MGLGFAGYPTTEVPMSRSDRIEAAAKRARNYIAGDTDDSRTNVVEELDRALRPVTAVCDYCGSEEGTNVCPEADRVIFTCTNYRSATKASSA